MGNTQAAHCLLRAAVEKSLRISIFSGDAGYRGTAVDFVEQALGLKMHISERIQDIFAVLPIRWIVERTFAWLGNFRRDCPRIMIFGLVALRTWYVSPC
ncbi:hypothetical protein [Nitrosomonas sp. Nm166]|uniref:hypothetical protein n=1 Tax=Nitrosomonas sp. Nm166 TaxID=1881054 RepID=UPI003526BA47